MFPSLVPMLTLSAALLAAEPIPLPVANGASARSLFGPTWVSIELPANPWNREARGAFLLVRALHHSTPADARVTGVAEGLVNGARRTLQLNLRRLSQTGVYAVTDQWGSEGEWVLLFTVEERDHGFAQAVVRVSAGEVRSVKVPTTKNARGDIIPRRWTAQETEQALRQ